jgi:glutamate-1-semialdehyde 2,1-aminomutase
VTCLDDVTRSDRARWTRFFHAMLARGVLLPPSPYEAWFLSSAHDAAALGRVLAAADGAFAAALA